MEDVDEQLNQRSSQISIPRGILSNKLHENQREITRAFPANGLNSKLSNIEIDNTYQQIGVFEQKQMEKEVTSPSSLDCWILFVSFCEVPTVTSP
jgi:hypothetical protein